MSKENLYFWLMFIACHSCLYTGYITAAAVFIVGMVGADALFCGSTEANKALIEALRGEQ